MRDRSAKSTKEKRERKEQCHVGKAGGDGGKCPLPASRTLECTRARGDSALSQAPSL